MEKNQEGFTLIEVTIAIALLSVIAFAVASSVVPVNAVAQDSKQLMIATDAAEAFLTKIQALDADVVLETYLDGQSVALDDLDQGSITITYWNLDDTRPLVIMNVVVEWTDLKNAKRQLSFETRKVLD